MFSRLKTALTVVALYLALAGIFGFSAFICEEAIQMLSFANFAAEDAARCDLIRDNCDLAERINGVLRAITWIGLWLNPPQMVAYLQYAKSVDAYLLTQHAKCAAQDPGLYEGRRVFLRLHWTRIEAEPGAAGWVRVIAGRFAVRMTARPQANPIPVEGILIRAGSGWEIVP